MSEPLLTVVLPCLNEADTIQTCLQEIADTCQKNNLQAEVIVADNGSTDGSDRLAHKAGARVVAIPERGYGHALRGGIAAARGRYIVMGDADDSYDFGDIPAFIARLEGGADIVIGNRFAGGIAAGAMPWSHVVGVKMLTVFGRLLCGVRLGDFHCGLRAFRADRIRALSLQCGGMDFATEMIMRAAAAGLQIEEVPTTLSPDGRLAHGPHLRTIRDGFAALRITLRCWRERWKVPLPAHDSRI